MKYTVVHPASELPQIESISQLTYMQDFKTLSAANKTSVLNSMQYNTVYNLIDNRDNKTYQIARLKDDNIWMAENLDLGRTDITTDLTSANTNLATTVAAETFNSWRKTSGTGTYDAGEFMNISGIEATSGTAMGTLYNYYAASAGTISGDSNGNNATYDICPAGWRLPTGGAYSGEFYALLSLDAYNTLAKMQTPITSGGAAFALAGKFYSGTPNEQGSYGYYWSSTNNNGSCMFYLNLSSLYVYVAGVNRRFGYAIRCVLDS